VEGEDPEAATAGSEELLQALPHLSCGLVRERDRQDLVRLGADRVDQMRDAVREDARLPGAGAGDDEQRPLRRDHGLALGGVEVGEVLLGGSDGHDADASGAPEDGPGAARAA
jgi:hypothetical protein